MILNKLIEIYSCHCCFWWQALCLNFVLTCACYLGRRLIWFFLLWSFPWIRFPSFRSWFRLTLSPKGLANQSSVGLAQVVLRHLVLASYCSLFSFLRTLSMPFPSCLFQTTSACFYTSYWSHFGRCYLWTFYYWSYLTVHYYLVTARTCYTPFLLQFCCL